VAFNAKQRGADQWPVGQSGRHVGPRLDILDGLDVHQGDGRCTTSPLPMRLAGSAGDGEIDPVRAERLDPGV